MIHDTQNDLFLIKQTLFPAHPTQHRVQRQAVAGLGLLGLGNSLWNGYQEYEIHTLQSRVTSIEESEEKLVHVVQDHQAHLENIDEDVKRITIALKKTELWMNRQFLQVRVMGHVMRLRAMINRIKNIVTALMNHRGHEDLGWFFKTEDGLRDMLTEAKQRGYQPLINSMAHFYQLQTSFMANKDETVDIFVHVPMVLLAEMQIYKLMTSRVQLPDGQFLEVNSNEEFLALSSENGQLKYFKAMSSSQLMECDQFGRTYLCENNNVLTKSDFLEDTCIGSLFRKNMTQIMNLCDHRIVPAEDTMIQLSRTRFLSHSKAFQTVTTQCKKKMHNGAWKIEQSHVGLQGTQMISLGEFCSIQTSKFFIASQSDVTLDNKFYAIDLLDEEIQQLHDFVKQKPFSLDLNNIGHANKTADQIDEKALKNILESLHQTGGGQFSASNIAFQIAVSIVSGLLTCLITTLALVWWKKRNGKARQVDNRQVFTCLRSESGKKDDVQNAA